MCANRDTRLPGLPSTASKSSLSRAEQSPPPVSASCKNSGKQNETLSLQGVLGSSGSWGQGWALGREPLAPYTYSQNWFPFLLQLLSLHFWRLCQREEKRQFKAIKILEGLKRIFILSKAKGLTVVSTHLWFRLSFHTSFALHSPFVPFLYLPLTM